MRALDVFFWINIAWMMAHELDAIANHEWHILPLSAFLPERLGYQVFVLAHVPLLVLIAVWAKARVSNRLQPLSDGAYGAALAVSQASAVRIYEPLIKKSHRGRGRVGRAASDALMGSLKPDCSGVIPYINVS